MSVIWMILLMITAARAEREHKVHNIILYPEKHSWCQITPIQQVVASAGYEAVTIDNNVCVGACYSYSIPRTQPAEPGELIGPYCDSCQPMETKCYHVTLKSDGKSSENTPTMQKRVQIITKCSCMSCEKVHKEDCEISNQNTLELPSDLFSSHNKTRNNNTPSRIDEIPELLHFNPHQEKNRLHLNLNYDASASSTLPHHHRLHHHQRPLQGQTNEQRYELNTKLVSLLKSIQNEEDVTNISYDKAQLRELLKIIEGSEDELSDKNLMEFVNFVNIHNSEDLELDLTRLKDVLVQFQNNQKTLNRHHDFELLQNTHRQPEGNAILDEDQTKLKKVHHLGDELHILDGLNGHLIKGPHGSMVLAPDLKVEEKLNIDSDTLKPNNDGLVISYENHHKNSHKTN